MTRLGVRRAVGRARGVEMPSRGARVRGAAVSHLVYVEAVPPPAQPADIGANPHAAFSGLEEDRTPHIVPLGRLEVGLQGGLRHHMGMKVLAQRKPMLLLRLFGLFPLRLAHRALS